MKFYYEGRLIRTSKTHHYTHAVINTENGKCLTCSGSRKGCEDFINRWNNESRQGIENVKAQIKALETGKNGYYCKWGREERFIRFGEIDGHRPTVDECKANADYYERLIAWRTTCWKVVEVEERA